MERDHLEYLDVDGTIILKWIFWKLDRIDLAHGRDTWWALVNAVMNFPSSIK